MKPSWVITIMLLSIHAGHAQTPEQLVLNWASQFSGASVIVHDLALDIHGNIYSIGEFKGTVDFDPGNTVFNLTAADKEDVFITKLNAAGNFVWAKRMGGAQVDIGTAITVDPLGNMYVTGYFNGVADFDPNNGTTNLLPIGGEDAFICKLDTNGILQWALKVGGNEDDEAYDVSVDSNGDVVFAGLFNDSGDFDPGLGVATLNSAGKEDAFITKLNGGGVFVWAKRIGGTDDDAFHSLALNDDDEVFATGRFSGVADFDPGAGTTNMTSAGKDDVFVLKLDVNGNFNWAKRFGSLDDDEGFSCHVDVNGDLYTTGYFNGTVDFDPGPGSNNLTSDGEGDVFISKLDDSGNMIWAKRFGGIDEEEATVVTTDADGNVYTTGIFSGTVDFNPNAGVANITATGMVNAFISKLTANGEFITAGKLSTDLEMESNAMVVNNEERLWIAGAFGGSGDFDPGPGEFILQAAGEEDAFLLKIEPCTPTASILDIAACEFYTSPSGNDTWTISGTYNDTIINVSGCDSVLTINLTIHHSTESEITVEACDEYMTAGGNFLTASGIYTEVVTNVNGCDSVIVINLTILESTIFAQDVTTCTSYISPGGEMYTETGTYYDTLTSSIECDSIIVTYLTIDTINTAVIYPIEGPILLAEQTNANYQWLDCNNNYQPIPGATEQSFTASENGSYAVIISFNDCIDTSACYVVSVGTHDLFEKEGLKLYPNPVQEKVTIEMTDEFKYGSLSIVDLHGREVYKIASVSDSEWQLHLDLVAGIYFVRVRSDGRYAVAKLIISY